MKRAAVWRPAQPHEGRVWVRSCRTCSAGSASAELGAFFDVYPHGARCSTPKRPNEPSSNGWRARHEGASALAWADSFSRSGLFLLCKLGKRLKE